MKIKEYNQRQDLLFQMVFNSALTGLFPEYEAQISEDQFRFSADNACAESKNDVGNRLHFGDIKKVKPSGAYNIPNGGVISVAFYQCFAFFILLRCNCFAYV
jgi:hypothetical protein